MKTKNCKILIIGLGQIGYHNAEYMTHLGLHVDGFDLDPNATRRALYSKVIRKVARTFTGYDCQLICVSTHDPRDMTKPNFDGLLEIAERLEREGTAGGLASIESTITQGISNKVNNILKHRLHVAHVPHRYFSEDKTEHGVRQLRVLGGCSDCCTFEALKFYANVLSIPVHTVKIIELAELSKIVENSYRYLQIAFAEELKLFCQSEELDFNELRKAINSKWNTEILEARDGIGGHCLPKDTELYFELTKRSIPSPIILGAIQSNRNYEELVKSELQFSLLPLKSSIPKKTMR